MKQYEEILKRAGFEFSKLGKCLLNLKCSKDKTENIIAYQKIRHYKDFPDCLCKSCENGRLEKWAEIKKLAKIKKLKLFSSKADFITKGTIVYICKNNHVVDDGLFCKKCFKKETCIAKLYYKQDKNSVCFMNNGKYKIFLKNLTVNDVKEIFKNKKFYHDKIFLNLKSLKTEKQNFLNILKNIGVTYNNIKDICEIYVSNYQLDTNVDKKIITNEIKTMVDVDFKNFKDSFLDIINDRNCFIDNYDSYLNKNLGMFENENNKISYIHFRDSEKYKNSKFQNMPKYPTEHQINEIVEENKGKREQHFIYNNLETSPKISKFLKDTFKTKVSEKYNNISEKISIENIINFIYTPLTVAKNYNVEEFVDPIENLIYDQNVEKRMLDDYGFTEQEIFVAKQYYKTIVELVKNIKNGEYKKVYSLVKTVRKHNESLDWVAELVVNEFLRSEQTSFIDKNIVVAIILLLGNKTKSPYNIYFKSSVRKYRNGFIYDGKFVSSKNLTNILYIKSGVAELFWKIFYSNLDLSAKNFDYIDGEDISYILNACPEEMFNSNYFKHNFIEMRTEVNVSIDETETVLTDPFKFLTSIFENKIYDYKTRSLFCRMLYIMYRCGLGSYIGLLKEFLIKNYHRMLNTIELNLVNRIIPEFKNLIILSEIKNMQGEFILDESKTFYAGTILKPKFTKSEYKFVDTIKKMRLILKSERCCSEEIKIALNYLDVCD